MAKKIKIQRALFSCWDKTGLAELASVLHKNKVEIISSGGTAGHLEKNHIPVSRVEEVTGFSEILDGRVKTLHPYIHGAILARRTPEHLRQLSGLKIKPIDLVVVNLYPFLDSIHSDKLLPEMIELIDIGGPAMLRAAAKNYENVIVLHHPRQYQDLIEILRQTPNGFPVDQSFKWATDVFFYTAYYDAQISQYLASLHPESKFSQKMTLFLEKKQELRYGENPHQAAALYSAFSPNSEDPDRLQQLSGKEMSFNNYVDVQAAASLVEEFQEPVVAIIKHTNPCGAATDEQLFLAFQKARAGDPLSAYGGIVACNRTVDFETAEQIQETFFECLIAPDYQKNAFELLQKKKNLRILKKEGLFFTADLYNYHPLPPIGMLVQESDKASESFQNFQSVGFRDPLPEEIQDLSFAWKVVKHVKSNAIVVVKKLQVIGVGAGQMSRVDSVKLACAKATEQGHELRGAVLASDAFFPFPDGVERAALAGITAIIQPGGSVRDPEVIKTAENYKMAMVLTGVRHFKH